MRVSVVLIPLPKKLSNNSTEMKYLSMCILEELGKVSQSFRTNRLPTSRYYGVGIRADSTVRTTLAFVDLKVVRYTFW